MEALCRDCLSWFEEAPQGDAPFRRCPACAGPRLVAHAEVSRLYDGALEIESQPEKGTAVRLRLPLADA